MVCGVFVSAFFRNNPSCGSIAVGVIDMEIIWLIHGEQSNIEYSKWLSLFTLSHYFAIVA